MGKSVKVPTITPPNNVTQGVAPERGQGARRLIEINCFSFLSSSQNMLVGAGAGAGVGAGAIVL